MSLTARFSSPPALPPLKLEQLQQLVAIVEHGSLRAAARRLHVPQPALTRSVRALEKELGAPMFLRDANGMTLTTAGRRFHAHATSIVNEARRALDGLSQDLGEDQGTVVAALSIMPLVGMCGPALPAFWQRYPKVRVQLLERLFPDVEGALRGGTVDFYFGAAPRMEPAPGLTMRTVSGNERAVVCRRGHPLAQARSLKELVGAQWAITAVDYNAEEDYARLFQGHGLPAPRVQMRASSAMAILVALMNTDLLAMLPVVWARFAREHETLRIVDVQELLPAPDIVVIRRPDLPMTPAAEYLCDVLLRQLPVPPGGAEAV